MDNSELNIIDEKTEIIDSVENIPNKAPKPLVLKRLRNYIIILAVALIALILLVIFVPPPTLDGLKQFASHENHRFYWMLLVGFLAEMVAGSMGMGYGVICTTILLILGIPPASISASIHSAEAFTSAAGAVSHYKYGNINWKLAKLLSIPGAIGAIVGALLLIEVNHRSPSAIKVILALYTMYLGIQILRSAFAKKEISTIKKKINIPALGLIGGFIDSFGGGGWGPLVTGTFIKNGRTPRYVIGSSSFAKFVLTLASAFTFFSAGNFSHWNVVAGLLIGGVITAPFSALLTSRLPVKKMFVAVGIVVIVCSLITLVRTFLA